MRNKRRKINNEFIDKYLLDNNIKIKRCSEFVNSHTKMEWECLVDGHKWITASDAILRLQNPRRCPKCKGGVKYTYDYVKNILNTLNLQLLDSVYKNNTSILNCKCKICNHIFEKTFQNIKKFKINTKYKSPCQNCNNRIEYTNENVDKLLLNDKRNIIRLSDIFRAKDNVKWECQKCNNKWIAPPQRVLGSNMRNSGCPYCKNKSELLLKSYIIENIQYDYFKHQYKIHINNNRRYIDFCLIKNNNVYFIERNGEQHYKPIKFYKISKEISEINYKKQIIRDKQIEEFCKQYDIKLIVIKYDMKQEEIQKILNDL